MFVPVRSANQPPDYDFSYTPFTAEDARIGKVTFKAVAISWTHATRCRQTTRRFLHLPKSAVDASRSPRGE